MSEINPGLIADIESCDGSTTDRTLFILVYEDTGEPVTHPCGHPVVVEPRFLVNGRSAYLVVACLKEKTEKAPVGLIDRVNAYAEAHPFAVPIWMACLVAGYLIVTAVMNRL
jgi:hypothetical protein